MTLEGRDESQEVMFDCDLVILAMGFTGAEKVPVLNPEELKAGSKHDKMVSAMKKTFNNNSFFAFSAEDLENGWVDTVKGAENYNMGHNVFYAGDCRRGASLVVTAIAEGRDVANRIDEYLLAQNTLIAGKNVNRSDGLSALPRCIPLAQNPALYTRADVWENNEVLFNKKRSLQNRKLVSESFERGFYSVDDQPTDGTYAAVDVTAGEPGAAELATKKKLEKILEEPVDASAAARM
jgi:hypothetical protein